MGFSRRAFLGTALAGMTAVAARPVARLPLAAATPPPGLLERARAALEQHAARLECRDVVALVDFSLPSRVPRLHVVNLADGRARSHWVAHGRGSDPARTGWLERFSNDPHSNATSAGAFRTGEVYSGAHGRSIRLEGLDASNSNAAARAIVVHAAWYVSAAMIGACGMLGRSQGCFAVAPASMEALLAQLPPGRLIYAARA